MKFYTGKNKMTITAVEKYPVMSRFNSDADKLSANIINALSGLSLVELLKLDIELHDYYVERTRRKKKYYNVASNKKRIMIEIFEGRNTDISTIETSLFELERARGIHAKRKMLWDKAWVSVYDRWIEAMKNIKLNMI